MSEIMKKKKIYSTKFLTKADISLKAGSKAYLKLREKVTVVGILKRSYGFYIFLSALTLLGLITSLFFIFMLPVGLKLAIWSGLLGFFVIQFGGLFHDAGHKAIFKSVKNNDKIGGIFSIIMAIPFSNWKANHNAHHANPNTEDDDPDLIRPLISFSEEKYKSQKGVAKFLSKYQVWTYYPVGVFTLIVFQLSNVFHLPKVYKKVPVLESSTFLFSLFCWLVLPFLLFPATKAVFVIVFVYGTAGFYMSNIFAPNHKGMPQFASHTKLSFLEHQIVTTRNINPSFLNDYFYMGLNYQIEHHLFPNCPRNKLKLITPYVKEVCRKMKIEFTSVGVIESNKIILDQLSQVVANSN